MAKRLIENRVEDGVESRVEVSDSGGEHQCRAWQPIGVVEHHDEAVWHPASGEEQERAEETLRQVKRLRLIVLRLFVVARQ